MEALVDESVFGRVERRRESERFHEHLALAQSASAGRRRSSASDHDTADTGVGERCADPIIIDEKRSPGPARWWGRVGYCAGRRRATVVEQPFEIKVCSAVGNAEHPPEHVDVGVAARARRDGVVVLEIRMAIRRRAEPIAREPNRRVWMAREPG